MLFRSNNMTPLETKPVITEAFFIKGWRKKQIKKKELIRLGQVIANHVT